MLSAVCQSSRNISTLEHATNIQYSLKQKPTIEVNSLNDEYMRSSPDEGMMNRIETRMTCIIPTRSVKNLKHENIENRKKERKDSREKFG